MGIADFFYYLGTQIFKLYTTFLKFPTYLHQFHKIGSLFFIFIGLYAAWFGNKTNSVSIVPAHDWKIINIE